MITQQQRTEASDALRNAIGVLESGDLIGNATNCICYALGLLGFVPKITEGRPRSQSMLRSLVWVCPQCKTELAITSATERVDCLCGYVDYNPPSKLYDQGRRVVPARDSYSPSAVYLEVRRLKVGMVTHEWGVITEFEEVSDNRYNIGTMSKSLSTMNGDSLILVLVPEERQR